MLKHSKHVMNPYLSALPPYAPLLWNAGFLKARFFSVIEVHVVFVAFKHLKYNNYAYITGNNL